MITHRVTIEPTHRTAERQYYRATLDDEQIVERSSDPEFATCRALKTRGLSGRVEFYRPGATCPGIIVQDLDKAAALRVVETEEAGPMIKKWRPFGLRGGSPLELELA